MFTVKNLYDYINMTINVSDLQQNVESLVFYFSI